MRHPKESSHNILFFRPQTTCKQKQNQTHISITMAEKTRYSDEELEEFRQIILDKLELARRDYNQMMDTLSNRSGNDVDDTMPTYKVLEEGSMTQTKEEITTMAARQQKFIQGLQAALVRIENKTYGICRVTGKLIPKERLRAVPHATLSIEAKQMKDRKD